MNFCNKCSYFPQESQIMIILIILCFYNVLNLGKLLINLFDTWVNILFYPYSRSFIIFHLYGIAYIFKAGTNLTAGNGKVRLRFSVLTVI